MLRKLLDNIESKILSNKNTKKFHPLHDALDTFLYSLKFERCTEIEKIEIEKISIKEKKTENKM